jgi:SNF2 family DNA or RNA helicase
MRSLTPGILTADVRVTPRLDGLVVLPRRAQDAHAVTGFMRQALSGGRLRRSAEGLWISAESAPSLLEVSGIDLRWNEEAKRFADNRRRINRFAKPICAEVKAIRTGGRAAAATYLNNVHNLDVLDDHQWVNVAAMTLPDGYGLCLFDEQGAGKTVTMIFAFDVLVARDQADFLLIVAPKSMMTEWPHDFERFTSGLYKIGIISGTRKEKVRAIGSGADVLVTNFETSVLCEQELRALVRRHGDRAILAVDESFYIKSLDAKRTQALRRLREWCGRAFVLCGTPAPNSPHDLVQQFNIVDFGFTFAGVDVPKDRDAARLVVQRAIEQRGIFVRHLKSDVLPNLPNKSFHRILLTLEPEQHRLYSYALRGLICDLRAVDDRTFLRQLGSFLAKRAALLQICSNPVSIAEGYEEVPAKLQALDILLEETVSRMGEKVVLWSFYTASIEALLARYSRFNPVRYDGTVTNVSDRRDAVRRFQEDDETMLFVGNPAAAGAGLTLHRARLAIYESMSNQAAHYLQSLDRIHRRGQQRGVEYLVLLCDRTIEIVQYDGLIKKQKSAQALLGDVVAEPMTRQAMLHEALNAIQLIGEEV